MLSVQDAEDAQKNMWNDALTECKEQQRMAEHIP